MKIAKLQHPYSEVISIFAEKYSDGRVPSNIQIADEDEAYAMYGADRRAVAVGFIRGWAANWDDKCLGIIVHPEYRGRDYGSLMLRVLETVARDRGEKRLRLHVDPNNHSARKLYEKNFWYPYGRRDDGEIIMFKTLERKKKWTHI